MIDDVSPDAEALEVRPPKLPAQLALLVAVASAVLAVGGLATGAVLLGLVALASSAWLASMAGLSLRAWARADDEGVVVHWIRTTQVLRWEDIAELRIDRRGPSGMLRAALLVRADGSASRWAPWFPFLSHTHRSVSVSIDPLIERAEAHEVAVSVREPSPRPQPRR